MLKKCPSPSSTVPHPQQQQPPQRARPRCQSWELSLKQRNKRTQPGSGTKWATLELISGPGGGRELRAGSRGLVEPRIALPTACPSPAPQRGHLPPTWGPHALASSPPSAHVNSLTCPGLPTGTNFLAQDGHVHLPAAGTDCITLTPQKTHPQISPSCRSHCFGATRRVVAPGTWVSSGKG